MDSFIRGQASASFNGVDLGNTGPSAGCCQKCQGCGKVANSDGQEPWTEWEQLPLGSDLAVKMGIVKPIACSACKGTGKS